MAFLGRRQPFKVLDNTFFEFGSTNATITLVTVSASGAVQALVSEIDKSLTFVNAAGSVQATTPEIDKTLIAISASASAQAVGVTGTANVNLTSVSSSGQINPFTFTTSSNINLTGTFAIGISRNIAFPITIVTLPVFSLMRYDSIASSGSMGVNS